MKQSSPSFFFTFVLFVLFSFFHINQAKTQIPAGDLMFVGFNADGDDGFALVALNAIPAVSTIYITDNNWNGSSFATTEGRLTWVVTTNIPAGSIVVFNGVVTVPTVSFGTVSRSSLFNLAAGGESIYIYEGTPTSPSNFITAYTSDGFGSNTLTGTGLTAGTNATSLTGADDVCVYVPSSPCVTSVGPCATQLANPSNWACEDGSSDQSNDGGIDFPTSVPTSASVTVLPIELLSFSAVRQDAQTVVLDWKTASELNNAHFEVECKTDNKDWKVVAKVAGAGNSQQVINYSTVDRKASSGLTYYRLSQTDFDGQKEYFHIVSVRSAEGSKSIDVYPNPNAGMFYVRSEKIVPSDIKLIDNLGRDVSNRVSFTVIDDNSLKLELTDLKSSIYFLRVGQQVKQISLL